jgi:signal transduction histidine kinase
MIVVIACVDLVLVHTAALGFLYILPLVVIAGFLKRWQIAIAAVVSALLREAGSPNPWSDDCVTRIALVATAFAGAALFVNELARNRQLALESVKELKVRQELERQLRHAQRLEAIGRLAGGIAHDFNNLLSVVIGFSDLALGPLETQEAVRRDVEEIRKAAQPAAGLTRQLLEFSRRDLLQPRVLDLNGLVSKLSSMLQRLIGESIDMHLVLEPELGRVKVDAGSIEQVIMNLVVNARDAMPHGGRLTIQTATVEIPTPSPAAPPGIKPGTYVTLAVQDTGIGMERNVQEHLFEPFFTTKGVGVGTGLGLSTVYGIVKQNGGDIWFVSQVGQGTTFTIYLPPTEAGGDVVGPPPRLLSQQVSAATVLLVEDDDMVRAAARAILTRSGLAVIEASNPAEAITIGKRPSSRFDLLLTDVVMPGMSGPELAQRLVKVRPRLSVLFMTGYADPEVLENERWPVIKKPFSENSLMQSVLAALSQSVEPHTP